MEELLWLPSLSHFANGNGWSGGEGVLRFEIEPPKEDQLTAVLWQDPFTRKYAEELERAQFPLTEAGVSALAQWITQEAVRMNATPPRTPQQLRDWRDKVRAGAAE